MFSLKTILKAIRCWLSLHESNEMPLLLLSKKRLFFSVLLSAGLLPYSTLGTEPEAATPREATLQRVLIDRDANRSIELVTDRHESVADFFARTKTFLAFNGMAAEKLISISEFLSNPKTTEVFVNYPLQSEHGYRLERYGAYLSLSPTEKIVAKFNTAESDTEVVETYLIFATADGLESDKVVNAAVVGIIRIFAPGQWQPEDEMRTLAYTLERKDR